MKKKKMKRNVCKVIQFEAYWLTRNMLKRSKRNTPFKSVYWSKFKYKKGLIGDGLDTDHIIRATVP